MERHSLEWLYQAKSREELEERYNEWASAYDKDLLGDWEYKLPAVVGDLFMKYVKDRDARILDAGVGTGLGGQYVSNHGYSNLYGIDMSEGMLDEARRKGIYQKLERMVLGEELDFPDDHFDAILSVGTIDHVPTESFDELLRITRPSGFIVFNMRTVNYETQFKEKLDSLAETGKWKLLEMTEPFLGLPGEAADRYYIGFVYQVL
jgi:predicted TPR repeat methyltransferase